MKPTDLLKEEHRAVKLALRVIEQICAGIAGNPDARSEAYGNDLARLVEFFKTFVDKCHHAKEEEVLFPALIAAGLPPANGPVQVMLAEHASGRKLVAEMDAALKSYRSGALSAASPLVEAARSYVRLLTDHIAKEDEILYPIADARIAADVQAGMLEAFENIETERIGPGTHEQFHGLLHELKSVYLK